ncbi:MAG: 2-oxoacid:acceptor oxidoreductase family protein, partial [candidate division WOR-3 bacterium]
FNRLSEEPIYSHSGIKNPDIVVVLDPSLIEPAGVTEGLKPDGILLVNTAEPPDALRKRLNLPESVRVYTVDASTIALETVGRDVPNTPMLGALARVTGVLELEPMIAAIRSKLGAKFRGREKLVEDNLRSIRRAFEEVKG